MAGVSDEQERDGDEALRRLWALSAPGRRGPKPRLTARAVVDAAAAIADADGLAAVSMARIANALECSTMALYRHIASKDELLALLADRVAADAPALPEDLDWRDGLRRWTQLQIEGILAHPWVLDLPLASAPLGPNRARWLDQGFALMRDLHLPTAEKGLILGLLSNHALAEARVQAELRQLTASPYADLGRIIDRLADIDDYPHLRAALTGQSETDADAASGIELILDGVEARLRRTKRH
jgi:AcrR family transcriptional regulator